MNDSLLSSHADYLDFYARQGLHIFYPKAMMMCLDGATSDKPRNRAHSSSSKDKIDSDDEARHGVFVVLEYHPKDRAAAANATREATHALVGVYSSALRANVKVMRHFANLCGENVFIEDSSVKRLTPSQWIHQHLAELTARQSADGGLSSWVVSEDGLLELMGKDSNGWVRVLVEQRTLDEGLY
jgi:hypothetical protein